MLRRCLRHLAEATRVHVVRLVLTDLALFLLAGAVILSAWAGWLAVTGGLPSDGTGEAQHTQFPGDRE